MQISYKLQAHDYINFNFYVLKKTKRWNWNKTLIFIVLLVIILASFLQIMDNGIKCFFTFYTLYAFSFPLVFAILWVIFVRYISIKKISKAVIATNSTNFDKEFILLIEDEYLVEQIDGHIEKIDLQNILDIVKTEDNFFIMFESARGFILPNDLQSENLIKEVCKKTNKEIQEVSNVFFKSKIWG